jgi:hypothetical protein
LTFSLHCGLYGQMQPVDGHIVLEVTLVAFRTQCYLFLEE